MSVELQKTQWQGLGNALRNAGYDPESFVREFVDAADDGSTRDSVALVERESSCKFRIVPRQNDFLIEADVPGTSRVRLRPGLRWEQVVTVFREWALELKQENEATDPWGPEAEEIAHDDSYFSVSELPKVDQAIDSSLSELKAKAIEHGIEQKRIEVELAEIKSILKKSARTSTKREWITLFKGIIVEKLVDWGMQTVLFQTILHVLITSAQEIHQLAEHAARHLPQ